MQTSIFSSTACAAAPLLRFAGVTDPGGANKENQDTFFMKELPHCGATVLCVLDGHGRETGRLASTIARDSLEEQLSKPEVIA